MEVWRRFSTTRSCSVSFHLMNNLKMLWHMLYTKYNININIYFISLSNIKFYLFWPHITCIVIRIIDDKQLKEFADLSVFALLGIYEKEIEKFTTKVIKFSQYHIDRILNVQFCIGVHKVQCTWWNYYIICYYIRVLD